MRTWLTERLVLEVPVICAPMAGVAGGQLAGAVSRAGGLGMIGVGDRTTPEWIEQQCLVATSSGKPFGVGLQAWALELNPGQEAAVLESQASLVSLCYGSYEGRLTKFKDAGMLVATVVGNELEARNAAESGVDLLIVRGAEGGGHGRNDVGTLVLLQEVLEIVHVPVVAAGGIANARGLAAVLAAGAVGAWVGTAFTATAEALTTPAARARLIAAQDTDTAYTSVFDIAAQARWPREFGERALRNRFYETWSGQERELEADPPAARQMSHAIAEGNFDTACIDAGQGVGLIRDVRSAAEVINEFARAGELLRRSAAQ